MSKLTHPILSLIMAAWPLLSCAQTMETATNRAATPASRIDWLPVVQQQGSAGVIQVLERQLGQMPEYELWMKRQERLSSGWNDQPFVNYIKYRHEPRQVYMSWLPGGPKAGQEILYDETRRKDAMYGHLSGILNLTSIWTSLDGSLARANSMHSVRDAGLHSVLRILRGQLESHRRDSVLPAPERIEAVNQEGTAGVAITWVTPDDVPTPQRYAARTRVHLISERPWIRQVESWDEQGRLIERIVFERVHARRFQDEDFDARNPAYRF